MGRGIALQFKNALTATAAATAATQDYYRIESVSEPTLSPDGRQVAYTRTRIVEADNKRQSAIWVVPSDASSPPMQVSDPAASATAPRWSTDGRLLVYSAKGQWFVRMNAADRKPFQLPGVEGPPVFSPDNRWIAFTKKVPPPKPPAEPISDFDRLTQERFKGRMYDWMNFRFDGRGYLPDLRDPGATPPSELFIVAASGGEAKRSN